MANHPENENTIIQRMDERGRILETKVSGRHMLIDDLKNIHPNQYTNKDVAEPDVEARGVVPHYPRPVAFHGSSVSLVATESGTRGILDCQGFKGPWGLVIGENEITNAEKGYLEELFLDRSPEERERQEPFLHKFTTSPVFMDGSRYGNFRFTFTLADVMREYSTQFCGGAHPVLRVYETVIYQQEVKYTVLIHSRDVHDYDRDYPELGDNDEGVCAYRGGEIIWRAQAISETHRYRLTENRDDKRVSVNAVNDGFDEFYLWDHVTLAFHMPKDQILQFSLETLLGALKACDNGDIQLNEQIGKAKAEEIIQEMKANA